MELLLNGFWAFLAVSVLYGWNRRRRISSARPGFITLACLLALLFPVISASDDLHAMRPEIEDSSSSRRSLRQGNLDRASHQNLADPPALPAANLPAFAIIQTSSLALPQASCAGSLCPRSVKSGRAPPSFVIS